ncbi:hypothetical protein FB567DRAFT_445277 [Paraphoma chrysanthemicola]|uniref:Uncharacterized protein n=1 Tax=Paraphoma chrysanthemicola TaxID=798071 RepID=A0A8K0VX40_9PLEO|nr:hypothetical protein FB567DRAFT_445277 [Paraphoma chrysanthemicola]
MPTYYARGVSLRLGAMPLADTITPNIVLRKGDIARKQCEEAENKLLGSELLPEERVPFPGDDADFQLHWLGDAPFMQVQVSSGVFQRYTNSNAHTAVSPHLYGEAQDPLALALHVKMSDNTFVSGLDCANKVHLKIEVFFNGQLSSCLFVPHYEIRSGAKSLHQVFAGCRVDYLSERPWIIIPPNKNADGSPKKPEASHSSQQRWTDISSALAEEAEQRGADKEGNIPPTAQFLKALSSMQMPDQVQSMQSSRGTSFGTIDVVITAGEGRKITAGASYLRNPQRLMDENYGLKQSCHKLSVIIDDDAGSDSGSDCEPQPKRRRSDRIAPARGAVQAHVEASLSFPERACGFQEVADHTQWNMFDSTPSLVPCSTTPGHHNPAILNGLPHHSFTDRRLSMPLPPTGLFSVPTKPKSSLSPTKRSRVKNIEKGLTLLVKRLTIVGKNGSAIVDHRWATPRSIVIQPGNVICDVLGSSTDRLSTRSSEADLTKTSNLQFPVLNPTLAGPSLESRGLHHTTKEGVDKVGVRKDRTKYQDSTRLKEDARVARFTKAVSGGFDHLTKAQRRTPSYNNILGVQGPKATTFWLEDPEEVLREAARLRRLRSPHKLKNTSNLQHIESSGAASTFKTPAIDSSSPLSSLATTPDPDAANPTPPSSNVVPTGIAQVDGPSDRMILPMSPTKFASSPAKLTNTANAPLFPQTPPIFTSSPACNSKKRKSQGRYLPKLPRDPDRLRTTSNPNLNEDCVIAFAESEDKDSEHGVLRQVKGERQGVFAEDYVVLATRFFVPGY